VSMFAHVVIITSSNNLDTSLHLDPSSSTGLDQAFDPGSIDKKVSKGPLCYDDSDLFSGPSVSDSGTLERPTRLPLRDQDVQFGH